jgi:hypothetical protein
MQLPPLPPIRTTSYSQNTHTVNVSSNSRVSTLTVPQGLRTNQSTVNFQRTQQNNLPFSNVIYNIQNQQRVRNF